MKIAIVTGASSGMGREMVFEIADRFGGIREIWAVARREERLKEFDGRVPVPVKVFPLDLTADGGLSSLEEALKEQKPEVKLLINAAGFGRIGTAEEIGCQSQCGCSHRRDGACASVYVRKQQNSPVCLCRRFFAPAGICGLRGFQGICIKLQPGFKRRAFRQGNFCNCRVPGTGGYGIF